MSEFLPVFNQLVASLTLGGQVIFVLILLGLVLRDRVNGSIELLERYGVHLIFLISLGGLAVSLFYSNFAQFPPCDLCWWQRIFMYAIFVISGVALLKKEDREVLDYVLALTVLGGLIAIYNSYLQYGGSPLIPCSADPNAVSCSQRFVFEYNYITIPLMSLTGFALIGLIAAIKRFKKGA